MQESGGLELKNIKEYKTKQRWRITLPIYGSFIFEGTEEEAEEMRAHKANWEGECAVKHLLHES